MKTTQGKVEDYQFGALKQARNQEFIPTGFISELFLVLTLKFRCYVGLEVSAWLSDWLLVGS